jgi:uncharacterized membrane protein required for colicin V production
MSITDQLMRHWVDLIVVLAIAGAIFRGYRAGFLASIFSAIGFVGGGLAGLTLGLKYLHYTGITKFIALFIAISLGSSIGEVILKRFAELFHDKVLFGPFKWLDSLLGVLFSLLRTLITILIVAHLLLITTWKWAERDIPRSDIYTYMNAYAPQIISQITKEAESIH